MGKGDLYRAVKRTGGFQPIVDLFTQMQKKRQQQQAITDIMNAFESAQNDISGIEPSPVMPKLTNVPGSGGQVANSADSYNKAQGTVNDFISSILSKPNVDTGRMQILTKILRDEADRLKPQPRNYQAIDPTKDIMDMVSGTTIRPGKPKSKIINYGQGLINTGTGEVIVPPKPANVKTDPVKYGDYLFGRDSKGQPVIDNPIADFNPNPKPPDVSSELGNIQKIVETIKMLKDAQSQPADTVDVSGDWWGLRKPTEVTVQKDIPIKGYGLVQTNDPKKIERIFDNEINKLKANKTGDIKAVIEKIETKVPGFSKTVDTVKTLTKGDASKVDAVVDELLKGKPDNVKRWLKDVVKAELQ